MEILNNKVTILNRLILVGTHKRNRIEIEVTITSEDCHDNQRTTRLERAELCNNGKIIRFSMSGGEYNPRIRDYETCGQCQDYLREISDEIKYAFPKEKFLRLLDLWDAWHLNDVVAGTETQLLAVAIWKASKAERYDYDKACKALKEADLYEDRGYKYGNAWLYRPLPSEVIEETLKLCEE
jgi:hypothetical protein